MVYLDNSATSFYKPCGVKKAVLKALKNPVNIGRTSGREAFLMSRKIYEAREKICDFIGGREPESVIFTNNATTALNFALKGIVKNENAHIITTHTEHNSILRQIYSNENISCSFIPCMPDYSVDISVIPTLIKDNTKLIVLNCASNVTGIFIDYKKAYSLIKDFNIPVLFDFSQAIGNISVDLFGMDNAMVAFSGHKSLLGPQGTGVLYVPADIRLKTIIEGGTGSLSGELVQPDFYPDRLESGTINTPGIFGLSKATEFIMNKGISNLREKKIYLLEMLYEKLMNMDKIKVYHNGKFNDKIPLISFNVSDVYSDEIASLLSLKYSISTRGGFHCAPFIHKIMGTENQGTIRVSVGYGNKKSDILRLTDSLNKIIKTISK